MNESIFMTNNLWMMISTILVFSMHLGFATLEAGLVQKKNVVNILFKNTMIVCIGLLTYTVIGFNLMYPGADYAGGFFGFSGFGLSVPEGNPIDYAGGNYTYWTDFIFQGMFAATCATIVSGAVAERIKLMPFLIFSVVFVAFCYPITGFWQWGGGWLKEAGFYDFAGSTLVHAAGGFAAVTTSLAAAAGAVTALFTSYFLFKSYDLSMVLNGILGGLVAITAGADQMSPTDAIVIGGIAGIIIPFSVVFFDKIKIDDPVGATSVHMVCGVWGTLAVGIFGVKGGLGQLGIQFMGVAAVGVFSFVAAFIIMYVLKLTTGIRVSEEEEIKGLDVCEHEMSAYADSPAEQMAGFKM